MTERDRPIYCSQCGSVVPPGENVCGVCGARVSPYAPGAAPAQEAPTQITPPPAQAPRRNRAALVGIAAGVLVVLLLAGAGALALTGLGPVAGLLGGEEGNAPSSGDEPVARENTGERPSDGASRPAPGYDLTQTPDRSLSVEAPSSWGVETGKDSEKQAGPNTWSYYAGEYLNSSITAAPNLDAWYSTGTSGAYVVASKSLAQYTDYELTHSLFYQNKAENCTKGPYKDYDRQPYSGKVQTWFDCGVDSATTYSIAAAPEGRACVVLLDARISEEADRKAIEHLIDTFEVDCGRVTSGPVATPTATASA